LPGRKVNFRRKGLAQHFLVSVFVDSKERDPEMIRGSGGTHADHPGHEGCRAANLGGQTGRRPTADANHPQRAGRAGLPRQSADAGFRAAGARGPRAHLEPSAMSEPCQWGSPDPHWLIFSL